MGSSGIEKKADCKSTALKILEPYTCISDNMSVIFLEGKYPCISCSLTFLNSLTNRYFPGFLGGTTNIGLCHFPYGHRLITPPLTISSIHYETYLCFCMGNPYCFCHWCSAWGFNGNLYRRLPPLKQGILSLLSHDPFYGRT